MRRVCIIGLDCAPPHLVFDRFRDDLPTLRRLMDTGLYGPLKSCLPPLTCPAWMCMMTGMDPGRLGVYGFRSRKENSYMGLRIASSLDIREPTLWEILSKEGRRSVVAGVPQTYPPKPLKGWLVSSILTPGTDCAYTYPESLKGEIEALAGAYPFDVEGFRTEAKADLLRRIREMTEKHFRVARYMMKEKPWDLFVFVEVGLDRVHHGFWKCFDEAHVNYLPGSPFAGAVRDYYRLLDRELGRLLEGLPPDTAVLVVSDHGAQKMDGAVCVNEWLLGEGYLKLRQTPASPVPLREAEVDWGRTTAWGEGGYHARIFLNVRGREPEGIIPRREYESTREALKEKLKRIPDMEGGPMTNWIFRPEEIYPEVRGNPPDLFAFFGELAWRSAGSVGWGATHTRENDTGPDDANHALHGILILSDLGKKRGIRMEGLDILDVAPTASSLMGVTPPPGMAGKPIALPG